jgi:hypothetical protein
MEVKGRHFLLGGIAAAALFGAVKCEEGRADELKARMIAAEQFDYFYTHYLHQSPVHTDKETLERDYAVFLEEKNKPLREMIARETGIGLEELEGKDKAPDKTQ